MDQAKAQHKGNAPCKEMSKEKTPCKEHNKVNCTEPHKENIAAPAHTKK